MAKNKSAGRRNHIAIIFLLLIVFALVPGRFALSKRSGYMDEKSEFERQTQDLEVQIAAANNVLANRDAFESRVERAREAMPVDGSTVKLIRDLVELSASSGITWEAGAPSIVSTQDLATYDMSMEIKGSQDTLYALLGQFRDSLRLITLSEVEFSFGDDNELATTIKVTTPGWLSTPEEQAAAAGGANDPAQG